MNLLEKIWNFSIHPTIDNSLDEKQVNKNFIFKIFKVLLIFYGILFLGAILSAMIAQIVKGFFFIDLIKIQKNNTKHTAFGLRLLIITVLVGPILEETMFRLWLSFKKPHIILSIIAIFWFILSEFKNGTIYNQHINVLFIENLIVSILFGFLIGYIIFLKPLQKFLTLNFKFFYWFSCIGFGLVHITNFHPFYLKIFWAYPFLVIPQLVMGFFLGYFRVKHGFFVSLLFHCLINLPSAMIYYFQTH